MFSKLNHCKENIKTFLITFSLPSRLPRSLRGQLLEPCGLLATPTTIIFLIRPRKAVREEYRGLVRAAHIKATRVPPTTEPLGVEGSPEQASPC